ncbi:MAG: lipoprotein [Romboutsia sp.]|nr:lipoprotein [Romboutsia sp.]
MKRKSILALTCTLLLGASLFLTGCGENTANEANNATDNGNTATQKLGESKEEAGEMVRDGAEAVKDGVVGAGEAIKYSAMNFKDDITNAGYTLGDYTGDAANYFRGRETNYTLDNDVVRVYEYDSPEDLDADIATISADGTTINNNAVYATKPYYYRKGNSLIVYEGSNPTYVDKFGTLYGTPLL